MGQGWCSATQVFQASDTVGVLLGEAGDGFGAVIFEAADPVGVLLGGTVVTRCEVAVLGVEGDEPRREFSTAFHGEFHTRLYAFESSDFGGAVARARFRIGEGPRFGERLWTW